MKLVGAVAIGELAKAGTADAIGVSAIAFGGSCGPPVGAGVIVICSLDVSVVVVGHLGGWKTIGGRSCACDVGGVVMVCPVLLMMSNMCLSYSYLSGLGMHLIVLALATLLPMPRSASPVAVSLPSQMALKKCCSIFGSCSMVVNKYCTVSPNSQSGALWSLFHLRK